MTTIFLCEQANGTFQVFGRYEGPDDRYVFGVSEYLTFWEALKKARWMMTKFNGTSLERTAPK